MRSATSVSDGSYAFVGAIARPPTAVRLRYASGYRSAVGSAHEGMRGRRNERTSNDTVEEHRREDTMTMTR